MATIANLIERIETRLAMASGLDVQIHAEDRLIEMLRHKYNILFDHMWWDTLTNSMSATLNGTTGEITTDISSLVSRFDDIKAVYYENETRPLPLLSKETNPNIIRTRCIGPSSLSTRVFKVYPITTTGTVHFFYRTRLADSVWTGGTYATNVPFDDEVLILGTVYDFLVDDESNKTAIEKFYKLFNSRLKQLELNQYSNGLSKKSQELPITTAWYVQ